MNTNEAAGSIWLSGIRKRWLQYASHVKPDDIVYDALTGADILALLNVLYAFDALYIALEAVINGREPCNEWVMDERDKGQCAYCENDWSMEHAPDCAYGRARKLLGDWPATFHTDLCAPGVKPEGQS